MSRVAAAGSSVEGTRRRHVPWQSTTATIETVGGVGQDCDGVACRERTENPGKRPRASHAGPPPAARRAAGGSAASRIRGSRAVLQADRAWDLAGVGNRVGRPRASACCWSLTFFFFRVARSWSSSFSEIERGEKFAVSTFRGTQTFRLTGRAKAHQQQRPAKNTASPARREPTVKSSEDRRFCGSLRLLPTP